jgi:hypothetical protein
MNLVEDCTKEDAKIMGREEGERVLLKGMRKKMRRMTVNYGCLRIQQMLGLSAPSSHTGYL